MKKVISVLLVCAVLCVTGISAFALTFPDLEGGNWDWARSTIQKLTDEKLIRGYDDGNFKPDNIITNEEAFALFARSLGVEQEINADAIAEARKTYAGTEAKYNTFARKELSYMLYRKVFASGELDTYLSAQRQSQPMLRHEAAVLITKIMGGEQDVMNKISYVLDFTDVAQIPAGSKGYVEYAKDHGIMQGMEDGSFSPMTGVTRAQMCMMMDRIMNAMQLKYMKGTILAVDTDAKLISFNDGTSSSIYAVPYNATFNVDYKSSAINSLKTGMEAVMTVSSQGVWAVDALNASSVPSTPDREVSGVFSSTFTDSRGTFIKVYDKALGVNSTKQYAVTTSTKYTYNGVPGSLSNLQSGDAITIKLSGETVVEATAKPRIANITGAVLAEIVLEPSVAIRISHAVDAYNNAVLPVSELLHVSRNGLNANLSDLIAGDKLTIKLDYDAVVDISATSSKRKAEGTITEINIGQNTTSTITLNVSGSSEKFTVLRDTTITVDDKSASIYDLRLGYHVTVNIESEAIKSLEVKSVTGPVSFTGTVETVNTSLGFMIVNITDTATGSVTQKHVFVKSTVSIIVSDSASKIALKDIRTGDMIMVTGAENLGAFEATAIIVIR